MCVCVFFTLADRVSAIPSNIRGCKSAGTWSAGGLVYEYDYLWPLVCCSIRVGLLQNGASFQTSRSIETTVFSIRIKYLQLPFKIIYASFPLNIFASSLVSSPRAGLDSV